MDPVSTKQGTVTPPIATVRCGQELINLVSPPSLNTTGEPVVAPPELWLLGSTGASFPIAELALAEKLAAEKKKMKVEEEHVPPCTPWQNGQAADTAGRGLGRGKENGHVTD